MLNCLVYEECLRFTFWTLGITSTRRRLVDGVVGWEATPSGCTWIGQDEGTRPRPRAAGSGPELGTRPRPCAAGSGPGLAPSVWCWLAQMLLPEKLATSMWPRAEKRGERAETVWCGGGIWPVPQPHPGWQPHLPCSW